MRIIQSLLQSFRDLLILIGESKMRQNGLDVDELKKHAGE